MADYIVVAIILIIVGVAIAYIVKEKKKGTKCIGCPAAGNCARMNGGQCSGNCHSNTDFNS